MATCNPSTLLSGGFAGIGQHELQVLKTQLLKQISGSTETAQEIMTRSNMNGQEKLLTIQTQILCNIHG